MSRSYPTRIDPTRTTMLRRRFVAEFRRRLMALQRDLLDLVVTQDSFGLSRPTTNEPWRFESSERKLELFKLWLLTKLKQYGLQRAALHGKADWLEAFIHQAYLKGVERAFADVNLRKAEKEKLDFYMGSRAQFLRDVFGRPVSAARVKLLIMRVYEDLNGVTEAMATTLKRHLVDGLVQGKSPREVGRDLGTAIQTIGVRRATVIARTETIRAHAEGAIDGMEALGVKEVGVAVEWGDANDQKVCPLCKALDGIVLKLSEARGMFPRHPNCRCSPIPANVGEPTAGQKRTRDRILQAIKRSVELERSKRSSWAGASTTIDKDRPKSILS